MGAALSVVVHISIHAPREGGDAGTDCDAIAPSPISIHAPREGGDWDNITDSIKRKISIHAPREGGDHALDVLDSVVFISIHAPREGGDQYQTALPEECLEISIHAPREGGDVQVGVTGMLVNRFQSTPPARGAT